MCFRLSEQFSELLEKTVRPGQKEVQQGLSMAARLCKIQSICSRGGGR